MFRLQILLLGCLLLMISCRSKHGAEGMAASIPYPSPRPDSGALRFLPGIVSSTSRDFGSAFSPNGTSFYFARTIDDQSDIFVTRFLNGAWVEPIKTSFNTSYSEADPAFAPDGKLYFISNRPRDPNDSLPDYDIWFVTWQNNDWSTPENLHTINSDSAEYYVSFTSEGHLYFASSRAQGFGEEDIYVSKFINSKYQAPENLGASVNTTFSEYDPFIFNDETTLVFASSNREDSFGGADLYVSTQKESKWSTARHLSNTFNTNTREYCPYISPDGKYFFFSSESDVKWIDKRILKTETTTP